jgi:hypothetical protein
MRQDRNTDLFPWILSLGLLAAGAFGAVLVMAPRAPNFPRVAAKAAEMHTLEPPPPAAMQASAPTSVPASVPDGARPPLAGNPIWQCEVNGQKIFADSPCGPKAFIRPLNETNRMSPTPIVPGAAYSAYEPPYTEPYSEDIHSVPGNAEYAARPAYWRRMPPRPARPHHPEPRGAPRAHGM